MIIYIYLYSLLVYYVNDTSSLHASCNISYPISGFRRYYVLLKMWLDLNIAYGKAIRNGHFSFINYYLYYIIYEPQKQNQFVYYVVNILPSENEESYFYN